MTALEATPSALAGRTRSRVALLLFPLAYAGGMAAVLRGTPTDYEAIVVLAYATILGVIAVHDARTLRAPNRVVYPALAVALLTTIPLGLDGVLQALAGGVVAFLLLMVVAIVGRGAMGYGDVKVGTLCGMAVGIGGLLPFLAIAFVGGGVFAAIAMLTGIRGRRDVVAFTPFLAVAAILTMVYLPVYLVN